MKLFLLVACLVALASARSMGKDGGDRDKGQGKKGPNPIGGLVKLCVELMEDAAADDTKRSWEDIFGQLAPICEALFDEIEGMETPRPSGPPPSRSPKRETGDRNDQEGKSGMGSGDRDGKGRKGDEDLRNEEPRPSGGNGPRPSGPPPMERSMSMDGDKKKPSDAEVLIKVCERLSEMAENEEKEGKSKKSIEAVLESVKTVCVAAFAQAKEDAGN